MRWVCEDLPDLKLPLENNILCNYNTNDYESMKNLCDRFNKAIDKIVQLVSLLNFKNINLISIQNVYDFYFQIRKKEQVCLHNV